MLNRLIKLRFPSGEKVDYVLSKTTLRIEVDAVSPACQFEKKWADESFAWIYESEKMDSDPLIPKQFGNPMCLNLCMMSFIQMN